MRLKPHEAQSYRKKALWVSWISIVITLILAIAAFGKLHLFLTYAPVTLGQSICSCWRTGVFLSSPLSHRK